MKKVLTVIGFALFVLFLLPNTIYAEPSRCPYDIHLSIMYNYLTNEQQILYDRMYDAIRNGNNSVEVPDGITHEIAEWMIDYIFNEAPELCSFEGLGSTAVCDSSEGSLEIRLSYKLPIAVQDQFIQDVNNLAASFRGQTEGNGVLSIYDYVMDRLDYGTVEGEPAYRAYFALKNNKAICNGYAQTAAMLCHFAGYSSSYIDGHIHKDDGTSSSHAWNVAAVDTRFIWFDSTWDDGNGSTERTWYGLDGTTMSQTHDADPEYDPIRYLSSFLPDNVTRTMHLDIRKNNTFVRGVTEQNGVTVRQSDLAPDERYAPALVIWNDSQADVNTVISYVLDGERYEWEETTIGSGSNIACRINEQKIKDIYGHHEITWYCNGNRLGVFTWDVN